MPEQHHHGAGQGVEEELDGGVEPARAAPDPDQEVHGDEHDLPEHVEEEHVERAEDAEHPRLQEEQEHVVLAHAVRDRGPGGEDRDVSQQGGQQDQEHADPVHPEEVGDADRGDPVAPLHELEAVRAAVEPEPERQADQEAQDAHARSRTSAPRRRSS